MEKPSRWLHAPTGVLLLLGTAVALPAAALVFLGIRLLQQDRALAGQQRVKILQETSDRAVSALDDELAAFMTRMPDRLSAPANTAPGGIRVFMSKGEVAVDPVGALAYFPAAPTLPEIPDEPFRSLETVEFAAGGLPKALEISHAFAASPDAGVQAGALLRTARILRKMDRVGDAIPFYTKLTAYRTVSINGRPADLLAFEMRCRLLKELSRTNELQQEALSLDEALSAGRWALNRENYEEVSDLLDEWLGATRRPHAQRDATAAAVTLFYGRWVDAQYEGFRPSGAQFLAKTAVPVTVLWRSFENRLALFVAAPDYLRREWLAKAVRAAGPGAAVSIIDPGDYPVPRPDTPDALTTVRTAGETGLPWTIVVTVERGMDASQFEGRRKMLVAGLAAVLVLAGAGSFLIVRVREREMALTRLQSDFVAAVSHEFRTPLTALRQFNDLLSDSDELPFEKRRAYYKGQSRATERLHRLVESLLDFGRMEADKRPYTLERIDAGALVRDVVEEWQLEISGRFMTLRCDVAPGDLTVNADCEALARALDNLIDNAVKYSGEGREVSISVGHGGGNVSIAVRDRGIGIPPSEQRRIFQKFVRGAAATSRHIRGSGIGLAMVQHIVGAHRGEVRVASVEHEGSTFTLVLPEAEAS